MGKIRIELKSDMCVSNGDSYNTMLDGDICYDDYGIPYIPAKRIKGCLREAAEELNNIGRMTGETGFCIHTEHLFGLEDSGALVLSNARLAEFSEEGQRWMDYNDFISDLSRAEADGQEFHQQQVVSAFTYIRKMTKIGRNGAAEDTSLRTLRVLKRGLIFEADASVDMSAVKNDGTVCFEELEKELEMCCRAFRHMGVHRTRGLGEVAVSLEGLEKFAECYCVKEDKNLSGNDAAGRLHYSFELLSPVVARNIEKGSSRTQDYLDGSKIIGILSKRIQQDLLRRILNDSDTIFSFAYIADENWHRYTPVPASFCEYKDSDGNAFIDRASISDSNRDEIKEQLSALDKFYVCRTDEHSYSYVRKSVSTEIRYHHARSADKGMGSISTDGSFYQIQSICEGQFFQGFIHAKEKYLVKIEEALKKEGRCRIGNMKSAEYGSAFLRVEREESSRSLKTISGKFAVRLNAPVIMYNRYGMYSTDETDFKNLITELAGDNIIRLEGSYKKYAMSGGFNSTWKMPKPVLSVLDKGSVFIFQMEEGRCIETESVRFIGERTAEGYGEIEFYTVLDDFSGTLDRAEVDADKKDDAANHAGASTEYQTSMIQLLAKMTLKNYCMACGRQLADSYYGPDGQNPKVSVILNVTNQLLQSLKERDSMDILHWHAGQYKIEEKKEKALELLELAALAVRKLCGKEFSIQESENPSVAWSAVQYKNRRKKEDDGLEEFLEKECLKAILEQLKYRCTESVKKIRNGGNGNGI